VCLARKKIKKIHLVFSLDTPLQLATLLQKGVARPISLPRPHKKFTVPLTSSSRTNIFFFEFFSFFLSLDSIDYIMKHIGTDLSATFLSKKKYVLKKSQLLK